MTCQQRRIWQANWKFFGEFFESSFKLVGVKERALPRHPTGCSHFLADFSIQWLDEVITTVAFRATGFSGVCVHSILLIVLFWVEFESTIRIRTQLITSPICSSWFLSNFLMNFIINFKTESDQRLAFSNLFIEHLMSTRQCLGVSRNSLTDLFEWCPWTVSLLATFLWSANHLKFQFWSSSVELVDRVLWTVQIGLVLTKKFKTNMWVYPRSQHLEIDHHNVLTKSTRYYLQTDHAWLTEERLCTAHLSSIFILRLIRLTHLRSRLWEFEVFNVLSLCALWIIKLMCS